MKIAKVRPIYTKSRKQESSNYTRPVSILPVFSKIFETLIYYRVASLLNKYNLIPDAQNDFRDKKSTYTAIQNLLKIF
jgi:hypothetical protein